MGLKTTEVPKISQNRQGYQGELVSTLGEPHPAQCMSCMVIKQEKTQPLQSPQGPPQQKDAWSLLSWKSFAEVR